MLNIRLYNKEEKEMIMSESSIDIDQGKRKYYPYEFGIGYSSYDETEFILMYGSGIYDFNNIEIYEGDIISIIRMGFYNNISYNTTCYFDKGSFLLKNNNSELLLLDIVENRKYYKDIKIIGNIYEKFYRPH